MFEVPNLDGLSTEIADYARAAMVFGLLRDYCLNKQIAMSYRQAGRVDVAKEYEVECDRLHNLLPNWARW